MITAEFSELAGSRCVTDNFFVGAQEQRIISISERKSFFMFGGRFVVTKNSIFSLKHKRHPIGCLLCYGRAMGLNAI